MTKQSILLVGAGGHARACIDVIEQQGVFAVAGLVGLPDEVGSRLLGYPVLGTDEDLPALLGDYTHALVTVGQIKTAVPRMRLFDLLEQRGCALPVIVSPRAYVSPHATLGVGTIVMHGAVINAGAVVGRNCIINSQALVEHDAVIADHCHIATAAAINGGVRIGLGTFIGSGSSVRQLVKIGDRCLIGMGQRVLADCEAGTHMPSPKRPS
ncbi:MAG TPA: acetyltransferase [Candidatus Binatia bacterium]|jgi:sugar O-acyltransferase (sialic acid O-acetyltransferase NeuD family)